MKHFICAFIDLPDGSGKDYVLTYHYEPGARGVRYTKNGDGWPDEPPTVEFLTVREDRPSSSDMPWDKFLEGLDLPPQAERELVERLETKAVEAMEDWDNYMDADDL